MLRFYLAIIFSFSFTIHSYCAKIKIHRCAEVYAHRTSVDTCLSSLHLVCEWMRRGMKWNEKKRHTNWNYLRCALLIPFICLAEKKVAWFRRSIYDFDVCCPFSHSHNTLSPSRLRLHEHTRECDWHTAMWIACASRKRRCKCVCANCELPKISNTRNRTGEIPVARANIRAHRNDRNSERHDSILLLISSVKRARFLFVSTVQISKDIKLTKKKIKK